MDERWVGYVYFIEAPEVGRIKIGYSADDPDGRFAKLDIASPVRLVKRALMPGSLKIERAAHLRFAAFRVKPEWFEFVPEIREYIDEYGWDWDDMLVERRQRVKVDPFAAAREAAYRAGLA